LVLTKIALNFVSPVVSPGGVKTGGFLITRDKAMKVLALATTFAGNLTIIGSVAHMIVVESTRERLEVRFWDYTRFGIPITILTTAAGVVMLLLLH
jgi:Na+/H+ antiporter NhaD/arsenite permease-like protein